MSLTLKILIDEVKYKWLIFRVTIGTWNVAGIVPSHIYIIELVVSFTMMS
jgi:hypothetical protein